MGFPGGSDGEESACNVGDLGSIPGLGRSPGEGHSYQLSTLAWTEEPGGLQSMESQESDMTGHSIDHDALICRIVTKTENKYKQVE